MAIFNNQDPERENNVGQFGATDESIGAYKQAAEYAKDAEYWAKLSQQGVDSIDELLKVVQELYEKGEIQAAEIQQLKIDFQNQDARLMQLISQTNSAVNDANNAIATIDQKIIEVQKQLDVLLGMTVTVEELAPNEPPTGSFDPTTGEIHLGIPQGQPGTDGKDGSVKDLNTTTIGVPEASDYGFYVDKDDNIVYRSLMSDIAKTFPAVQSISYNGGGEKEVGDVDITKEKLGLGNVINVPSYSQQEIDGKVGNFIKTYLTKNDAVADTTHRKIGEKVLIWNGTSYDFYDIIDVNGSPGLSPSPSKTEKRIVTVNLKEPDSAGNIDITVPTGNPSLYLGEMLMFPYDPDQNITYQGVLPADGRLINRAGNEDLVASLISGSLPVVTEAEWQAGATTYFSWGPSGTSTTGTQLRLPDWTGGAAIRSPDKTADASYSGNAIAQVPYIVTVNGLSPNDQGQLTLTAADLSGSIPITKGGTGATDAATARANLQAFFSNQTNIPSGTSLNTYDGSQAGVHFQNLSANATTALNYPSTEAGALIVYDTRVNHLKSCVQTYYTYNSGEIFYRRGVSNSAGVVTWSPWVRTWSDDAGSRRTDLGLSAIATANTVPVANGGTGATDAGTARTNLGLGPLATATSVGIPNGGTGATNTGDARANLSLDKFQQYSGSTQIKSPSGNVRFTLADNSWSVYDDSASVYIPLTIGAGGTGSVTAAGARTNLGLGSAATRDVGLNAGDVAVVEGQGGPAGSYRWFKTDTSVSSAVNLNNVNAAGLYPQIVDYATVTNAPITSGNGYILNYIRIAPASGTGAFTQFALPYAGNTDAGRFFFRGFNTNTWSAWKEVTTAAPSDERLKNIQGDSDIDKMLDNVGRMEFKNFTFKSDEDETPRRGLISQQIEAIDPEYVKEVGEYLHLDETPLLLDGLGAIKALKLRDEAKSQEIEQLKAAIVELKAAVAELSK